MHKVKRNAKWFFRFGAIWGLFSTALMTAFESKQDKFSLAVVIASLALAGVLWFASRMFIEGHTLEKPNEWDRDVVAWAEAWRHWRLARFSYSRQLDLNNLPTKWLLRFCGGAWLYNIGQDVIRYAIGYSDIAFMEDSAGVILMLCTICGLTMLFDRGTAVQK